MTEIFNQPVIVEGWYWTLQSKKVKKGKAYPFSLMGRELVIYRGKGGEVACLDAYCPHMGAHLAEGRVEGNELRCFFHNWRFNNKGHCTDIPCLKKAIERVCVRSFKAEEKYGLIWVWTGRGVPDHLIPTPPELEELPYAYKLGNFFQKNCHPNVVMINAIDEQHFQTVHKLPGHILNIEQVEETPYSIRLENQAKVPSHHWFGRLINRFYKGPLRYQLKYWYGSNGVVTLGPDCLHLYIMFALRQTDSGKTEGKTIVFTKQRRGPLGWLFNQIILFVTKIAGFYFSIGDTRVFKTINFDFQTPIPADKAVIAFIKNLEKQKIVSWRKSPCKKSS